MIMQNGKKEVVVTGIGIKSPIGNSVDEFFNSILEGIPEFSPVDFLQLGISIKASYFKDRVSYEQHNNGYSATTLPHETLFNATIEALEMSKISTDDSKNTIALIGTTSGGSNNKDTLRDVYDENLPGFLPDVNSLQSWHSPSDYLCRKLNLRNGSRTIMNACSSGAHAVGYGKILIQNGRASRVIVGGVNTLSCISMLGFHSIGVTSKNTVRPFDADRDGIFLGEGAAVLILESRELAESRNAHVLAKVSGFSASSDIDPQGNLTKPVIEGYSSSMKRALEDACISTEDIDYINAHGTATGSNDLAEAAAIKDCFPQFSNIPVSSTKSSTGHTLGAAGAIASLICVKAIVEGIIPPNKNLSRPDPACDGMLLPVNKKHAQLNNVLCNAFGFGGNNTSVVFSKYEE